jgi:phosphatidylglycerophosphatase C
MKKKTVAIFDLDGTLTKRDTFLPFLFGYLMRKPILILRVWTLGWSLLLFRAGRITNETLKQHFLEVFLKGTNLQDIEGWTQKYVKSLVNNGLWEKTISRLEDHRDKGHVLCILSASFDFYVHLLADELGVENVICTRAELSTDNRFTGQMATPNCYGEEKVRRLEEWLCAFENRPKVFAYGDNLSDIPLLERADHGVLLEKGLVKSIFNQSNS